MKTKKLKVKRTVSVNAYEFNGKTYFKTREIADLLQIKQPYDFTQNIKKMFPLTGIIKGDDTRLFRKKTDDERETFVEKGVLVSYLGIYHNSINLNKKKYLELMNCI